VKATGLKKSDVIRLAIERGVDVLLSQLLPPIAKELGDDRKPEHQPESTP
jgi:hypothetical protein